MCLCDSVAVLGDANCLQDEVAAAEKSIDEKTTQLIAKGRWMVPGYKVRCTACLLFVFAQSTDPRRRRSLATSPSYNHANPRALRLSFVYSSIVDTIYQGGRAISTTYTPLNVSLPNLHVNYMYVFCILPKVDHA